MPGLRPPLLLACLAVAWPLAAADPVPPVRGFVNVDPFELRLEFVLRFDAIAPSLEKTPAPDITADNRAALETALGAFLAGKCPIDADGARLTLELDRVHFVRPDPVKGLVVDDRERIPAAEAMVGAVFATAWDAPPAELRVVWEIFPPGGEPALVEAGAPGNRAARKLAPDAPELIWKNEGVALPTLVRFEAPPDTRRFGVRWPVFLAVLAGGGLAAAFLAARRRKRHALATAAIALALAAGLGVSAASRRAWLRSPEQVEEIVYGLLRNVYHAFDYRRETDIYDTLALSASGELLTRIYLEVQRSLQLEDQGGARVRVYDLDLRHCEPPRDWGARSRGSFVTDAEWVAVGTVTHWGHTHQRVNRYRAVLTIAPVEGRWRLVDLSLESEERL
ncbi:MAG: hypothetical protein H7A53_05565 [Akkermansiaceae bacterium]|nr:hypothetical protein [Akkermansiaceae bacterium]